ncbi:MAG TPA: hypothetical protein VNV66_06880, partial [Pilimelia sp.]|nr:hypothetical protein [Pilimelia sp.]
MTDPENAVWRDEERLPLSELADAMAISPTDGQVDDVTGNDAGAEQEFGHGPRAREGQHGEEHTLRPS